jgi:hypothetical protein
MPKQLDDNEIKTILECIAQFPDGASLKEISDTITVKLLRHTLMRRLKSLVETGKITVKGRSRAKKYLIIQKNTDQTTSKAKEERNDGLIPLTLESKVIEEKIRLPIQKRTYVNYNREFLDDYIPNSTQFLSKSISQHLLELGKTNGESPAGTYARQILNRLLIDLSWNSSRLEGNTYSLLETERLLQFSEFAEGKDINEAQMILNHKAAIEFLTESEQNVQINRYTILNLHALLSNNLLGTPEACGRLRKIPVGIGESVYQPTAIPQLLEECFQQILDKANIIKDPFEQSFFLMVHLPYLQPFEDVNKRVSRLSANIPLINHNLCPLSFTDVPSRTYINGLLGVYELNRIELLRDVFVWAYERSCLLYSTTRRTLGEPDPFRLRYRTLIFESVKSIVQECLNKKSAITVIRQRSQQIPSEDQDRFIEAVEVELRGLHEGNIARYRLRPAEFDAWHSAWEIR